MSFVEVAVNSGLPHRDAFSYAVPEGMTLQAGDGVFVPFGRRKLQGIVLETPEVPSFADPKPVDARIGDRPVISAARVKLARWISEHYLAPLFASVSLMLPPGFEQRPLTFYEPVVTPDEAERLTMPPRQKAVLSYLLENGASEGRVIEREVKLSGVSTALSQLSVRGVINRTYGLARPSVQAKKARYVHLVAPPIIVEAVIESLQAQRKGKLVTTLQALIEAGGTLSSAELRARVNVNVPLLKPLEDDGLIEIKEETIDRDPLAGRQYTPRAASPLTPEQERAFEAVAAALAGQKAETFLLHGVTGSGKTEVYLRALEETVALGRRGIVLVPEIALTPQTVRRFAERFPGKVAVLHSGLSQGELFDQWHGIRDGRYSVVIGSRSAVFAPQPDLGLIVIDEEHEWTYKQQDQSPRYHARAAAIELARLTDAVVILGSATPDVESYQQALWGNYTLLELKERVRPIIREDGSFGGVTSSEALPPVEIVDMREELKGGNRTIFSRPLQLGIFQALERGEQTILFLNRRGSAGFVQCRDCGFVPQCSACAIAMGYHKHLDPSGAEVERLLCHQCNRGRRLYDRCPMCGSRRLRPMGLGVERVEEAVRESFPTARTLRWDRDVTQGRDAHEDILSAFLQGKADVLIGTQMVAKGLDLPAVTVVGVISADIGLHIPDFRSAERTFQLLTQVAGRAGRTACSENGPPRGKVVIQTYTPDNYAIIAAGEHDYASFFAMEIALRREEAYPPFIRLARLVYSHANAEVGERAAQRMADELREEASKRGLPSVEVLGPAQPHIPKWHGRTRWQVTVRSPDPTELLRDVKLAEGWALDIDPASLA
jgi:primosomal protein N' (replication factor Y)